jgi:hypothetical protein
MEVVIDFEFLCGYQNEIIIKELAVAGKNVSESLRFESPYAMAAHGSDENGLNWDMDIYRTINCSRSSRRLWQISPTSTASGPQNANCCPTCWGSRFTTCETLIALIRAPFNLNSAAVYPVTDFSTSVVQLKTHILYTLGSSIT